MNSKTPPSVRQTLFVDPDTGDRAVLTEIDPRAPGAEIYRPLAEMLQRLSPAGRIERAQREATALPDNYPEKAAAEESLEMAAHATGNSRLLRIAQAELALLNARRRREAPHRKRTAGGRRRGEQKRQAAADAWATWEAKYQDRIVGKDRAGRLIARRLIAEEMRRAGFVVRRILDDPSSGEFPSRRTLERRFPAK